MLCDREAKLMNNDEIIKKLKQTTRNNTRELRELRWFTASLGTEIKQFHFELQRMYKTNHKSSLMAHLFLLFCDKP
jgi:hypothetical protein